MALMFSRIPQHILQRVWLSRMCCLCFCPLPGGNINDRIIYLLFLFHLYLSFTKVETKVLSATLPHGLSYQSHHCPMAMVHLMAVDSGHSRSVSMDVWIRSGPWKIATSRPISTDLTWNRVAKSLHETNVSNQMCSKGDWSSNLTTRSMIWIA